jgi:hypothetical protein
VDERVVSESDDGASDDEELDRQQISPNGGVVDLHLQQDHGRDEAEDSHPRFVDLKATAVKRSRAGSDGEASRREAGDDSDEG